MVNRALVIAVMALGCDDPEITSAVAAVLENGIVSARLECPMWNPPCIQYPSTTACHSDPDEGLVVSKMVDGSAIVTSLDLQQPRYTLFLPRGSGLEWVHDGVDVHQMSVADGLWTETIWNGAKTRFQLDLEANCTGFNLEAFGVE